MVFGDTDFSIQRYNSFPVVVSFMYREDSCGRLSGPPAESEALGAEINRQEKQKHTKKEVPLK
jgi:hypothetical protein